MTDYYKQAKNQPNISPDANQCFMCDSSGVKPAASYGVAMDDQAMTNVSPKIPGMDI